jgi:predicted DNA-binding antitoxin AbrB/MazE fold protein
MSEGPEAKIQVVYEGGVFKPLHDVDLLEGTRAFVVLKPGRITSIARRYRTKVDKDAMSEFVEERR